VEREYRLARSVGLNVSKVVDAGLPFPSYGAVVLPDQLQLDPMDLLAALAAELRLLGGVIVEGVRVHGVHPDRPRGIARVTTSNGELIAKHVILASGVPILNRGLYFAKVSAMRSYAQSFELPSAELPNGMFLNVENPTRSIRTWRGRLLTGGNGHPVGREASPRARADDLTEWTQHNWPGATLTHSWSAQDYSPMHHVPFVGWLPRGGGRIYLATGFDKWGMTNGVATALTLFEDILGTNTDWQQVLHSRVTMPRVIARGIGENAAVGFWYAKGYARALARRLPDAAPREGQGVVGRSGMRPTASSTVDGVTCQLSAICTHLGGVVTWNDAERSWDCPCHGSRFDISGAVLHGPAVDPLGQRTG
jgi:nitrite reductase/ring-hydroxylating ferredoxin subunit